ncbi:MAG: GMP reductase [Mycoplasmatales bacterium]
MKIFDYEDITLIPNKCIVESRSECVTTQKLGKYEFAMPVVPANMQTVVDETLAETLAKNNFFYIMHRFDVDAVEFTKRMQAQNLISSVSIGVKEHDYKVVDTMIEEGVIPEFITIDIAHGHSVNVENMIKYIKSKMPETFVIAGNVGTPDAVRELERWGADATKVGIGPGKVCITKLKTGFGTGGWQLAALNWCSKVATKPIIADGGIRNHGDIAKSIRFGATFVMIGSLFAGHDESPGELVEIEGKVYKEYFGSASQFQKGEHKNVEGKKILVDHKGSILNTLHEMREDLQSSISYAGGKSISAIHKCDYVIVKNSITNGDNY